jgi:hypothetical protein
MYVNVHSLLARGRFVHLLHINEVSPSAPKTNKLLYHCLQALPQSGMDRA